MKKLFVIAACLLLGSCVTIQKQYTDGKVVKDSTKVFIGVEFRKGK